ncbi:beta-galactosidase GalB [Posidoniimonas corsicana]|nr:beta-galactosidase GalB [Posidoniimonas corsicana]
MVYRIALLVSAVIGATTVAPHGANASEAAAGVRTRESINFGWRFYKYGPDETPDPLVYDARPEITDRRETRPADERPTEAVQVRSDQAVLKPWILPTANAFIKDPANHHARPAGSPGSDFAFVQAGFDDTAWESVDLPHDWAIAGPFSGGWGAAVSGGMGRLPSPGVAWYRRQLDIPESSAGKSVFLEVDGAMSYAMVWLNGQLVGGWPFGYASWQVDLTPYIRPGGVNQLAIRLDNPPESSRWYPGGGLYRNVWLTTVSPIHIGQWGTCVTTRDVSPESAVVELRVEVANRSSSAAEVTLSTDIYELGQDDRPSGDPVASIEPAPLSVDSGRTASIRGAAKISSPRLWGPPPTQEPHRYLARTRLYAEGEVVDEYDTPFGIRDLRFDPNRGVLVNGEHIPIRGANQHHDLGPLGAAFNVRAAERQLEVLREAGCNAIRMSHNPPAQELLDLTDKMGFLVIDETFDVWERKKTPLDFHLIFPEWSEPDTRALVRRDRNHPSVIAWSIGNEVGEQYTGEAGAAVARRLHDIVKEEDPTRPTTTAMNFSKPDMPLPAEVDLISLNYQGEGIRDAPAYRGLQGIRTPPLYPAFREAFPDKVIVSSENAAAVSTRGAYLFPVTKGVSAPVADGAGGDPDTRQVSSYELYTTPFGSSADKVFRSLKEHPFVAGGFVWSGWDYLGEPTPYYLSRSSYFGIVDLAGFKKDRFYLYQSHWRPDLPLVHILPHWTWPGREGQVTPVHVFTSGDEVELFLNGQSLGRQRKTPGQHRLRWDDVAYQPGTLRATAYKDGREWASSEVQTAGAAAALDATVDRDQLLADGRDLAFVSIRIADSSGVTAPLANHPLTFELKGPGEIIATANGDPTNLTPFPSSTRSAFHGRCLAIVRTNRDEPGELKLTVRAEALRPVSLSLRSR